MNEPSHDPPPGFVQGLVRADGVTAVRCSGVFKIGPKFGDDAG